MYAQFIKSYQYYSKPVSFIISFHVLLLINIPIYHAQNYAQYYEDCSNTSTVTCGNMTFKNPGYPFWGQNIRPLQCGLEGFELSCENNDLVLDIGSGSKYHVADINPSGVLLLNRYDDPLGNICASREASSTVLNEKLYNYGENTEDLNLFYNCDTEINSAWIESTFTCPGDSKNQVYFFLNNSYWLVQDRLGSCSNTTLLVDKSVFEEFKENGIKLQELFNSSFEVQYNMNNKKACSDCMAMDGLCWSGTYSDNNTCLYSNGTVLPPYQQPGTHKNSGQQIAVASGVVGGTILLLLVLLIYYRWMEFKYGSYLFSQIVSSYPKDVEASIRKYGSSIPKRFKYSTVKKITNSFKDQIGKGGYGNVYRGTLDDGRIVAVKVLNATKENGEDFMNEVASIGRTSHVNIVTLLGFCYEGKKRALIYEFMPNGSLEKFIHGKIPLLEEKRLGWEILFSIAIGIARGLEYLHQGCNTRILHFDIKPHNILLDKDFRPKISDFGLAKLYTTNESAVSSLLQARGTIGYIAPEVTSRNFGQVSHKSDVYSYGMMILEMVGGRKNVDARANHTSEVYFPDWLYKRIQFEDVLNLANDISKEENELVRKMVIVGLWCIQIFPLQRPPIGKVIELLEGPTAALEIPPNPYFCSFQSSQLNSQTEPSSST